LETENERNLGKQMAGNLGGLKFLGFFWRSGFGFIGLKNECQFRNHEIAPGRLSSLRDSLFGKGYWIWIKIIHKL
jgi:hypothetical protein